MSGIRITKLFAFETGHALYGYDGKCKNVHGHSYKLSVTVFGKPITDKNHVKYGMVIDFSDLKKIVKEEIVNIFDHATVFNKNTPHLKLATQLKEQGHNILLSRLPTHKRNDGNRLCQKNKNQITQSHYPTLTQTTRNRKLLCRMVCLR